MKRILITSIAVLTIGTASAQQAEVEKALQEKYMKEHGEAGMAKLQEFMNNMSNATTRPVYTFPIKVNLRVTEYKKGVKKDATDMELHVNAEEQTFAMTGAKKGKNDMYVVYDSKNNAMIMLDDKKKTYTAMNINAFMSAEMQAKMKKEKTTDGAGSDVKCNKTGNTKSIKGYTCSEYVCIDEEKDSKVEVWVTDKPMVNLAKAAKGQPWSAFFTGIGDMNGMMMEGKMYENGQLEGTMEVTELNEQSSHVVQLNNYTRNDMFAR